MSAYRNPDPFFESPAAGRPMALCTKCKCIKPWPKEFTNTRSRIYAEERNVPRHYESSVCRECMKPYKTAKPSKRTKRQLHNDVVTGEVTSTLAETIIEARTARARSKMTKAIDGRWEGEFGRAWQPVVDALKAEIHRNAQARKYILHPPANAGITQGEMRLAFYEAYAVAMRALKARIEQDFVFASAGDAKRCRPTSPWWVDYLTTEDWEELHATWNAIHIDARVKLRAPDLLHRNYEAHPEDRALDERLKKMRLGDRAPTVRAAAR
jgi:hypothetical protein